MEPLHRVLAPAVVRWEGDRPYSVGFGDVYHGTDGAEEAERVFLEPARFDERVAVAESFTVGELGFGLGRNFALAAERFLARSAGRLHYVAFEQAPAGREDLERAARRSGWAMHRRLVDALPPAIAGWHRRRFAGGRVLLSLYFGDVLAGLTDLTGRQGSGVDAWFFDGFAPRCNPEMWSAAVCDAAAALSQPGATVTTYSSAGVVKRALRQAGFIVRRVDQRPRKWHALVGVLPGSWSPRTMTHRPVSVVGAGFAGCAAARALAERGFEVSVHDASVAAGASAIPAAVVHPRLLGDGSGAASLRAHGYGFAVHALAGLAGFRSTGALQLRGPDGDRSRLERILPALPPDWIAPVSAREASEIAGVEISAEGLHFPDAGLVDGPALCRALIDHRGIHLERGPPAGQVTVLASASRITERFPELEVAPLEGQADLFPGPKLRVPVLGDGYAAPAGSSGECWVGATYEYRRWEAGRATAANGERFRRLFGQSPATPLGVFRGTRAVTSDRLPVIGRADADTYVTAGHGSSGTTTAVFAGEWIASLVAGECPPVTREVETLCRVERFRERQLRRPNPFARRERQALSRRTS
ncbi:MAG: tRNA (5-methylaminomethyl-2-thiouridine)(34)-methyltransferase MnmD [Gammaproteobacteria bacterium]|nr:tRNA (5-methylaminomethyl-2-thiouridine)(34)-methyltransferase MnmD [Gammaproteobacteria bacterium]